MILRILITESQSSKELEMPEKTGSTWEQREYNNDLAQIHASGGAPGATVPLTAAGHERGERGAKIAEGVRHAVDRAIDD
jgi:hypothetical protein